MSIGETDAGGFQSVDIWRRNKRFAIGLHRQVIEIVDDNENNVGLARPIDRRDDGQEQKDRAKEQMEGFHKI